MKLGFFTILLWIAAIIGEIRCIYQFITSDFKPSYKREIIYGVSMCTGIGAVTGWMNFPDEPEATTVIITQPTPVVDTTHH